jgi:hypothetical protein
MYGLHVQGQTINQEINKQQSDLVLLGLLFSLKMKAVHSPEISVEFADYVELYPKESTL